MLDSYVEHKRVARERKARAKVDLTHPEGVAETSSREKALTIALRQALQRHNALVSALRPIREHFGALAPVQATKEMPEVGISAQYVRDYVTARLEAPRRRGNRSKDAEAPRVAERAGTVGDRTVSIELAYLRAAIGHARDEGEIPKERVPKIKLPRGLAKARRRTLKRTEFRRFMVELFNPETTPDHLRTFVLLGMLTSQREKALKACRWPLVDYDEGVIRFTETDPDAADNKRLQDTPLTPDMARWLQAVQERARSEYVIEWNGEPVGRVKSAWDGLLARSGLTDVRIHDLRRAAATIALNAGADLGRIALLLNDDEATVRRNYAHAHPDLLLGVVRLIENQVAEARAPLIEAAP